MQIPVYIVNRDRLTCTKKLIDWLIEAGTEQIVIMDNGSTYEPLLSYYQELPRQVELRLIGRNGGPWIFWELYKTSDVPYVVTDSDTVPAECCPINLIEKMSDVLSHFPKRCKIGPGLRLDNIPDTLPFKHKVTKEQQSYWQNRIGPECFAAPIDTTFALYRAGGWADSMPTTGIRMDFPYVAEHWPWYQWPLNEEEQYYFDHAQKDGMSNVKGYIEEALHG